MLAQALLKKGNAIAGKHLRLICFMTAVYLPELFRSSLFGGGPILRRNLVWVYELLSHASLTK